jgi:hypothetical protein
LQNIHHQARTVSANGEFAGVTATTVAAPADIDT